MAAFKALYSLMQAFKPESEWRVVGGAQFLELNEHFGKREIEILASIRAGLSNQEIARALFLSLDTVKWYNKQIFGKLGVKNRIQAIQKAIELGLLKEQNAWPAKEGALPKHNLPAALDSFIGRREEITWLDDLLSTQRLVTLTGPGGVGKTRLGLAVAEKSLDRFPDGVWLIELAPLSESGMVAQTVANTMGVRDEPGWTVKDTLCYYFRRRQALLLLDNCEHLLEACASLVEALLSAAPRLKILVTSRESLGLPGEHVFRVPSLSFPAADPFPSPDGLSDYEAIALFCERAKSVLPKFQITPENASQVIQICQRLDGIPLALELAAARVASLDVAQIAARLDHVFLLLAGGSRGKLSHHHTLRAAIDWSYQLLAEKERLLLQRLSVFAGGATLEAIAAVCSGSGVEEDEIPDGLYQLVIKSMLQVERQADSPPRYHILEMVRQYANEKLVESGDAEQLHRAHMDYYLHRAEDLEDELRGREQVRWLRYFDAEMGNLPLALEWGLKADVEAELRLAAALMWFWHLRNYWKEGIAWLEKGLAAEKASRPSPAGDEPPFTHTPRARVRAKGLFATGVMYIHFYNWQEGEVFVEESLELHRDLVPEDRRGMAYTLWVLAEFAREKGDVDRWLTLRDESFAIFREIGDRLGIREILLGQSMFEEDYEKRKSVCLEALALMKADGDIDGTATVMQNLGHATSMGGDYPKAIECFEESLRCYRQVGNTWSVANQHTHIGWLEWQLGHFEEAARHYDNALTIYQDSGDNFRHSRCLLDKVRVALSQGRTADLIQYASEALRIGQEISDTRTIVTALIAQARLAWLQGDTALAYQRCDDALAKGLESKDFNLICEPLYFKGRIALTAGDIPLARSLISQSLVICQDNHCKLDPQEMANLVEACAFLTVHCQEMEKAACLFGAAERVFNFINNTPSPIEPGWRIQDRIFNFINNTLSPIERGWREQEMTAARGALGESLFLERWSEGKSWSREQAVACALEITASQSI